MGAVDGEQVWWISQYVFWFFFSSGSAAAGLYICRSSTCSPNLARGVWTEDVCEDSSMVHYSTILVHPASLPEDQTVWQKRSQDENYVGGVPQVDVQIQNASDQEESISNARWYLVYLISQSTMNNAKRKMKNNSRQINYEELHLYPTIYFQFIYSANPLVGPEQGLKRWQILDCLFNMLLLLIWNCWFTIFMRLLQITLIFSIICSPSLSLCLSHFVLYLQKLDDTLRWV